MDKGVKHEIQVYDTLQGISLQYQVSVALLRKANNLQGDTILHLPFLLIPNCSQSVSDTKDQSRVQKESKSLNLETLEMMFKDVNKEAIKVIASERPDFDEAVAFIRKNLDSVRSIGNLMREFPINYGEAEKEFLKFEKSEKLA